MVIYHFIGHSAFLFVAYNSNAGIHVNLFSTMVSLMCSRLVSFEIVANCIELEV